MWMKVKFNFQISIFFLLITEMKEHEWIELKSMIHDFEYILDLNNVKYWKKREIMDWIEGMSALYLAQR